MTEQERKTFKWGDQEYLLDDLLKIHAEQENNYYNFARDKGQYNEEALVGLRKAIQDRIGAVKAGKAFGADGVLDTDVVDNTSIQTQKKGLFKKEKYVDQDNTEWAKYYLNKLVGQLNPYNKSKITAKGAWDINKHGLGAYLNGQGVDARRLFETKDLKVNADDPNEVRQFVERDAELKKHLPKYQAWLKEQGFDFTKNDNPWDDDFETSLAELINMTDYSDRNAVASYLNKLGAGNGYVTAFTSDKWDLSKSNKQIAEEARKQKEENEEKKKGEYLKDWEDYAYGQRRQSNPTYHTPFDYSKHNFKKKTPSFMNWYGDLNAKEQTDYGTYLGRDNQKWKNAWTSYINSLKNGTTYSDKNLGILLQGTFESQPHAFIDLGDGRYLINDSITASGQGTVYDPVTGYTDTVFLGDLSKNNDRIKSEYEKLAYKYINDKYGTNYDSRSYVFKEGGNMIPKHQYGNAVVYNWETDNQVDKQTAQANGRDLEQQQALDRYTAKRNKSEDNPDAGFTVADTIRLASIGADITSMFLDPLSGTVVGLGSSAANLLADFDDGVHLRDFGNFGMSVGLDLLGAIPVVGDVAGTGTKITKNLLKYAPKVMAGLSVYQGAKNVDGMVESWGKLTSTDSSDKMTVQDWRNIAQSIQLLTGGVRAAKNIKAKNKMMEAAKVPDATAVNVRNKQTGEVTKYIVNGETAKALRGSKTAKDAEVSLSKLERFKNHFGDNGEFEVITQGKGPMQFPLGKTADGWGWRGTRKPGAPDVGDYYDFSRTPNGYGQGIDFTDKPKKQKLYEKHRKYIEDLNKVNSVDHKGAKTVADVDAEIKALRDPIDAEIENMKGQMKKKIEGVDGHRGLNDVESDIKTTKEEIKALQKKLRGIKESDVQAELLGLRRPGKGLKTLETQVRQTQTKVNSLDSQIKAIDQQITAGKAQKRDVSQLEARKTQLESQIQTSQSALDNLQLQIDNIKGNKTKHSELESTISDFDLLRKKQRDLNKLNQELQDSKHTSSYKRLQKMIQDYQTNHSSIEGRNINWDLTQILKDAGITKPFKHGGSIDRTKINKFLNYAKG